ncbi:MAG: hypothetical protein LBQ25_13070 [Azonexus sp.]|nr:hypothetical protein [Azonexus sp.]
MIETCSAWQPVKHKERWEILDFILGFTFLWILLFIAVPQKNQIVKKAIDIARQCVATLVFQSQWHDNLLPKSILTSI